MYPLLRRQAPGGLPLTELGAAEARSALEKALSLDPYDAEALGKLGAVEAGNKNYARAGELWRRALRLDPDNVSLKKNLDRLDGLRRRSFPRDPRGGEEEQRD